MSTQSKINTATKNIQTGDIIKYFDMQDNIVEKNDGIHDFRTIITDCYSKDAPFPAGSATKLALTDATVDIINMDKTYFSFKTLCNFSMTRVSGETYVPNINTTKNAKNYAIFVGLKSGSHILENYKIYSNGRRNTNSDQMFALEEQNIVRLSKTESEIKGRPRMYTDFENAYYASDCVCGTFIKFTDLFAGPVTKEIEINMQLDDLLPFSAMELFPRFMFGELELEIKTTIEKNFVWCPVDLSSGYNNITAVLENAASGTPPTVAELQNFNANVNRCFNQCGDANIIPFPVWISETAYVSGGTMIGSISINSMTVTEGKSNMQGFNIKNEVKEALKIKYANKALIIPAQWADYHAWSNKPTPSGIKLSSNMPFNEATQISFTFPRTENQKTVCKNPLQNSITCVVGSVSYPSKTMSTLDSSHCEMILSNLEFDTLFQAPKSLLTALTFKEYDETNSRNILPKSDNSDYMFTVMLERPGDGIFWDGFTSNGNVGVVLTSTHLYGSNTPSYFTNGVLNADAQPPEMVIIQDAAWKCTENGIEFVK